jgi:hypothetical protein
MLNITKRHTMTDDIPDTGLPKDEDVNYPLTAKSVAEFHECFGNLRLSGYEIASDQYITELNRILDTTSSYAELKKELTEFVRDREKFAKFLNRSFNYETGEYHI